MNVIEREAIILNSAWKMINGMVNWSMFAKTDLKRPTNLMFEDVEHQKVFIILLRDFLSQVRAYGKQATPLGLKEVPHDACPSDRTFLFHLRQVCECPQLEADAVNLRKEVESFAEWLEGEFLARDVWLSDMIEPVDIRITRYRYITMCGDIAKHHLGRLSTVASHMEGLLKQSRRDIDEQTAYLVIEDFFGWFFDNVFLYHSSQIAEFLNNIRWAIFRYLQPEFERAYHLTEDATPDLHLYSYDMPEDITQPMPRAMYWDVMNRVGQGPWMERFTVHEAHKLRY